MKPKSAFTLIELLVVISIIAVLAALLAPALIKMLENGKATDDANNLRSLGQAIASYRSDQHDAMFASDTAGDDVWPKELQRKYVRDWRVFRSPFDRVTSTRPKTTNDPVPVSYGMNEKLFGTFAGKWTAPVSSLIVLAPAIDANAPGRDVQFLATAFSTNNVSIAPTGTGTGAGLGTHGSREMINVLFGDGNVRAFTWKQFSDFSSEAGKAQWDPHYVVP